MEILGIDVGGSGIKGAIVDTVKGELITERFRIPTPQPATPDAVIDTITEIIKNFNWRGPIGCGFPAAIVERIVRTASNIDNSWIGVNASDRIQQATGCPTRLVNDVDAAGYAEMEFGAGRHEFGTVFIAAFGTGIGTAVFTNHELVTNTELGHIKLGNGMVAEHYTANSIRERDNLSWTEWGDRVNEYLKEIEFLLWPDLMIIGGGVSKDFEEFSDCLKLESRIIPAENQNHAGIIGAALSARSLAK